MSNFPALDVALGLSFVYLLLSVLSSALTETISAVLKVRSKRLEEWLSASLEGSQAATSAAFYETPAIHGLTLASGKGGRRPSYIPSPHFVSGVLSIGHSAASALDTGEEAYAAIGTDLERLRGSSAGNALLDIYARSGGSATRFRRDAEAWFDDAMERLSGRYRRWAQAVVWITGAIVVIALNANSLRIASTLWSDPAARSIVTAQAGHAASSVNASEALDQAHRLPLPIGWHSGDYKGVYEWLTAAVGGLLTLGAMSLGAPFWFDALSRVARLRMTGTPPPASNAVRRGEGDEIRGFASPGAPAGNPPADSPPTGG